MLTDVAPVSPSTEKPLPIPHPCRLRLCSQRKSRFSVCTEVRSSAVSRCPLKKASLSMLGIFVLILSPSFLVAETGKEIEGEFHGAGTEEYTHPQARHQATQ